jgi:hypothetical protein
MEGGRKPDRRTPHRLRHPPRRATERPTASHEGARRDRLGRTCAALAGSNGKGAERLTAALLGVRMAGMTR